MKIRLLSSAVFAFLALALSAQTMLHAPVGYAAQGVVLQEYMQGQNRILLLTTTPCAGNAYKREVQFIWPYDKTAAGSIRCGSITYPQSNVRQQPHN